MEARSKLNMEKGFSVQEEGGRAMVNEGNEKALPEEEDNDGKLMENALPLNALVSNEKSVLTIVAEIPLIIVNSPSILKKIIIAFCIVYLQ